MDSKCSGALQTAGNSLVKTILFFSVLLRFHVYGKTILGLDKNHSLSQWCESLGIYKVSVISQMFSSSIARISSPAWSEHDAFLSPFCCPPQGLTLTLQEIKRRDKVSASQLNKVNLVWSFQFSVFSKIWRCFEFYLIFKPLQKVSHTCSVRLLQWDSMYKITCLRKILIFHKTWKPEK